MSDEYLAPPILPKNTGPNKGYYANSIRLAIISKDQNVESQICDDRPIVIV